MQQRMKPGSRGESAKELGWSGIPLTPAFAGQVLIGDDRSVCRLPLADVEISCPAGVMHQVLRLCDGQTPFEAIKPALERRWGAKRISALLRSLAEAGVLVDGRALTLAHWPLVENPMRFGSPADAGIDDILLQEASLACSFKGSAVPHFPTESPFLTLLRQRRSWQTFADKSIALQAIVDMLWSGYGIARTSIVSTQSGSATARLHRTTPTVGRASSLVMRFINLRPVPGLPAGAYRVAYHRDGAIRFVAERCDLNLVFRANNQPWYLMHCQGIVIVGGDFRSLQRKYGNRAALLAVLEAGHAMQNMYLSAAERSVAAVEVCGFNETPLRAALGIDEGELLLSSMMIGAIPDEEQVNRWRSLGQCKFRWFDDPPEFPAVTPLYVAEARLTDAAGGAPAGFGRGRDARTASIKAIAEAHERLALARPTGLVRAPMRSLAHAVDPRTLVCYSSRQYADPRFPYAEFDPTRAIFWKEALDTFAGSSTMVAADCVYFASAMRKIATRRQRPLTACSSSGAAAHVSCEAALQGAALELIERDAFMRAWYQGKPLLGIVAKSLPGDLRRMTRAYADAGIDVVFRQLASDLAPVVCVCAKDRRAGHFLVSAAAHFDPELAARSAFEEAEARFCRWSVAKPPSPAATDVSDPDDHEALYSYGRHASKVEFLLREGPAIRLKDTAQDVANSMDILRAVLKRRGTSLLAVDLTPDAASFDGAATTLSIWRVIIPGLVPVTFGHGLDPLGLARVDEALRPAWKSAANSGRPLFPHPFA